MIAMMGKKAVNPGVVEICNDLDDNCSGKVDEGCDDDKDGYCDIAMIVVELPAVCKAGGGDCDDGNDKINPGMKEDCATIGIDDNCDGKADEGCVGLNAVGCGADGLVCGAGKGKCSSGHCFWTDAKGYKWTLVPAGTFWMGCNAAVEGDCPQQEKPQHLVDLSAYWIGLYEVTVADYKACVDGGGTGCSANPGLNGIKWYNWGIPGKEQHPMNYVTWEQSQAYCNWLGGDLPTEAQWEKAARGGCEVYPGKICASTEPKFPWASDLLNCGKQAVFAGQVNFGCNTGSTYPVGTGSLAGQSPYGAYDMAGNVYEWNLDWYDTAFYGKVGATQKNAVNSLVSISRVIRGGSFLSDTTGAELRASRRLNYDPGGDGNVGVRCARPFP